MPTRTEHIPCPVCGVPRPVQVKGPADIARAQQTRCKQCGPKRFTPYTADIQCPRCGTTRPIRIHQAHQLSIVAKRICQACNTATNLGHGDPNDIDTMAVERLVIGQPVQATPAERREAVAFLTRRKLSNRAIAERIGCTQRTVERHRQRLAS